MSPISALPTMPPALFVVWTSVAVGTVLSTVTEPVKPPVLPDASVAVTVNDFAPATSGLLAVSEALR